MRKRATSRCLPTHCPILRWGRRVLGIVNECTGFQDTWQMSWVDWPPVWGKTEKAFVWWCWQWRDGPAVEFLRGDSNVVTWTWTRHMVNVISTESRGVFHSLSLSICLPLSYLRRPHLFFRKTKKKKKTFETTKQNRWRGEPRRLWSQSWYCLTLTLTLLLSISIWQNRQTELDHQQPLDLPKDKTKSKTARQDKDHMASSPRIHFRPAHFIIFFVHILSIFVFVFA